MGIMDGVTTETNVADIEHLHSSVRRWLAFALAFIVIIAFLLLPQSNVPLAECAIIFGVLGGAIYFSKCMRPRSSTASSFLPINTRYSATGHRFAARAHPQSCPRRGLKAWVDWMYQRPEIGRYLNCKIDVGPAADRLGDIWNGAHIQNFLDPDREAFFLGNHGSEGQLLFSFHASFIPSDKQNPEHGETGMYMTILNLPPSIRSNTENIYHIGVTPGPIVSSKHHTAPQLDLILEPLIDELRILWKEGLYLPRTSLYPHGRRVYGAVAAVCTDEGPSQV